jgi:alkaline phosphatase
MTKSKLLLRYIIALVTVFSLQSRVFALMPSGDDPQKVKYVFLFIGDGMGLAQVNLTEAYLAALQDRIGFEPLNFTKFPQVGLVSTYANDQMITCSAAAGTALATGHKTNVGRISMDPSGSEPYESIATKAKKSGFKVGIVTSTSIDHATPAAFYAHQPDRNMYFEIGLELAQSDFDFFAGGGFLEPDDTLEGGSVNVIDYAMQKGFNVVNTRTGFEKLAPGGGKTLVLSPDAASEASLPFAIDMEPGDITLADYTAKAIGMLYNDKGFFLMVEGGKIDWACHGNDAATAIQEVLAFEKAIGNAVAFYEMHPEETLIIVTADHETGGLALGNQETGYDSHIGLLRYQKSSEVGLYKIAGQFRVNKSGDPEADFTRLLKVLETDMGLNSRQRNTLLTEDETASLKKIFVESVYGMGTENTELYGKGEPFIDAAIKILAGKAGISWGSTAHSCVKVPVYSRGIGAERFSGLIDNTDIPKIIGEMMGIQE